LIPCSSAIFNLDSHLSPLKNLGVHHIGRVNTNYQPNFIDIVFFISMWGGGSKKGL
jgi:hypothetical protein